MNFIFYIFNIVFSFISRSFFIRILGADINGLNSLYMSLIGFLNVAELGVGAAVGYSLYEPLSKKKYFKINDIMILFKYYYINIAKIILILGSVLSLFLKFLVKGQVNINLAYIYYFLYLINCSISYLFTYKQTLIIADQKQYKIAYVLNTTKIMKMIVQCILLYVTKSFFVWILLEILFNLLGMILVNHKINLEYKNNITYKSNKSIKIIKNENFRIGKNIRNVFFHKLAGFVVGQTDAILISIFSNLKETGIYTNYIMIISALTGLLGTVIGSVMPSIGNLIAEESKEKSYKIFKKLYLLDNLLAGFISFGVYKLINEFIIFWVGKEYLFSNYIVMILVINLYIQISRGTVDRFKDGFGIYWDVFAPIIESIINLIFSLLLAWKFGIVGIFIGTIISNIVIVELWKPYIVFKEGFNIKISNYVKQKLDILTKNILIILFSNIIYEFISRYIIINNIFLKIILDVILISLIYFIFIYILYYKNQEFKELFKMIYYKIYYNKSKA
ncbi:hypothetical protein GNF79_06655 [Clostridium perfringens]|uniref:Uncharacterized protein n=1 Tax=Clostridium perfringens TaxID=1502 RepID=A0AAW9I8H6_CLOPF|nr:hypothetical protein [Clostridium perfringens]MDH5092756.1 hypothetical protein [Clostridium perfringens]MDZ4998785.1 hypothetical protein [Clostridium perfringens]